MSSKKSCPVGDVESALASYGEAFMAMFDDHNDLIPRTKGRMRDAGQSDTHHLSHDDEEHDGQEEEGTIRDDVDAIFNSMKKNDACVMVEEGQDESEKKEKRHAPSMHRTTDKRNHTRNRKDAEQQRSVEDGVMKRRMEKKRFMSSKADVILAQKEVALPNRKSKSASVTEKEEFQKISREIQHFGASGLNKKARAKFEEKALMELGVKKKKGNRIPASIGIGMAKKAAQREKRALEEAIAAGMVSRKSAGKKKATGIDRGLNEDMGAFKGGVLRVAPRTRKR